MEINKIYYGMGRDYLPKWGIKEALREIYQNFLDYGTYQEEVVFSEKTGLTGIELSNDWNPDNLEFLRIGNTQKNNSNAIGKHGEGIKMAFLIMARLGFHCEIITSKYIVIPEFYTDKEAGECFCMSYIEHNEPEAFKNFTVHFELKNEDWQLFQGQFIKDEDIIFSDAYYGDIVKKESGNIYSGRLFVIKLDNISRSYNIRPDLMPLDRDRSVPHSFDVEYNASRINELYKKWTLNDLDYADTKFITQIPEEVKKQFTPKAIGNSIEFTYENDKGETKVLANDRIKEALKGDSFFSKAIKKLKYFLIKKMGLYDMLLEFKEKHITDPEAAMDFDLILEKVSETKAENAVA